MPICNGYLWVVEHWLAIGKEYPPFVQVHWLTVSTIISCYVFKGIDAAQQRGYLVSWFVQTHCVFTHRTQHITQFYGQVFALTHPSHPPHYHPPGRRFITTDLSPLWCNFHTMAHLSRTCGAPQILHSCPGARHHQIRLQFHPALSEPRCCFTMVTFGNGFPHFRILFVCLTVS